MQLALRGLSKLIPQVRLLDTPAAAVIIAPCPGERLPGRASDDGMLRKLASGDRSHASYRLRRPCRRGGSGMNVAGVVRP